MEKQEPPATIKEVGIHITYMREDIHELKRLVESMATSFATKDEVEAVKKRVSKLERRNDAKNTLLWVGLVTSAIINIVVIYQLFAGNK